MVLNVYSTSTYPGVLEKIRLVIVKIIPKSFCNWSYRGSLPASSTIYSPQLINFQRRTDVNPKSKLSFESSSDETDWLHLINNHMDYNC